MLLDGKSSRENHQRFVERVAAGETVYYLCNEDGVANSVSNANEEIPVLPFWSDAAYARRAAQRFEEPFDVDTISLLDFLYRWLPGMTGDGVLAGVNWNADLCGDEVDPFELRREIEGQMSDELLQQYEDRVAKMMAQE